MAEYTEKYKLKKPAQEDNYDVEDFNKNAEIIEAALDDIAGGLAKKADKVIPAQVGNLAALGEDGGLVDSGKSDVGGSINYSPTKTYAENEICTHNGGIWKSRDGENVGNEPSNATITKWAPDNLYSMLILYVSQSGSDTTGTGEQSKPLRTLTKAASLLPLTCATPSIYATIHVDGTYVNTNESVIFDTIKYKLLLRSSAVITIKRLNFRYCSNVEIMCNLTIFGDAVGIWAYTTNLYFHGTYNFNGVNGGHNNGSAFTADISSNFIIDGSLSVSNAGQVFRADRGSIISTGAQLHTLTGSNNSTYASSVGSIIMLMTVAPIKHEIQYAVEQSKSSGGQIFITTR